MEPSWSGGGGREGDGASGALSGDIAAGAIDRLRLARWPLRLHAFTVDYLPLSGNIYEPGEARQVTCM